MIHDTALSPMCQSVASQRMARLEEVEEAVIGDFAPIEAIEACEREYKQQLAEDRLTDDVKFTYAWHLIKSQYKNDIRKGIRLMDELVRQGKDQRDYYYFVALGHYKLEQYESAERYLDRVLHMEPQNQQAKQLKQLIAKKIRNDLGLGLGVLGGAALVGGVVAAGAVALVGYGVAKMARR